MIFIEKSEKSVQGVVDSILEVLPECGFGLQHIHNVKNKLNEKGVDFQNECQILDICNPNIANSFLSEDMTLSTIMPCKISVFTDKGETTISMVSLAQLVDDINPDLIEVAEETQAKLLDIIERVK